MAGKLFAPSLVAAMIGALVAAILSANILANQSSRDQSSPSQPGQDQPNAQRQSPSQQQPPGQRWEYRMLSGPVTPGAQASAGKAGRASQAARTLEQEINRLAEQGYEVDAIQAVSPSGGSGYDPAAGRFRAEGEATIVVLMKRPKR